MTVIPSCDFEKLLKDNSPEAIALFHANLLLNTQSTIHAFFSYVGEQHAFEQARKKNDNSFPPHVRHYQGHERFVQLQTCKTHESFIIEFLKEKLIHDIPSALLYIDEFSRYDIYQPLWDAFAGASLASKNYSNLYLCLDALENIAPTKSEIFLRTRNVYPSLTKDFFAAKNLPWIKHDESKLLSDTVNARLSILREYMRNESAEYIQFLKKYVIDFEYGSDPAYMDIVPPTIDEVLSWATGPMAHQRVLHWEMLETSYPGIRVLYELHTPENVDGLAFGKAFMNLISLTQQPLLSSLEVPVVQELRSNHA